MNIKKKTVILCVISVFLISILANIFLEYLESEKYNNKIANKHIEDINAPIGTNLIGDIYIKETEIETEIENETLIETKSEIKTEIETNFETESETELKLDLQTEIETEIKSEIETEPEIKKENKIETIKQTEKENIIENKIEIKKEEMNLKIDHDDLYFKNNDYRGWLDIPGAEISYPVVKGIDNSFYLEHDFDKNPLFAGTLFIDAYSVKGINQDNLIIYGHNMKNKTMFGRIKNFKDPNFFNTHKYINFYSNQENKQFIIFSIRESKADITNQDYALEGINNLDFINGAINRSIQSNKEILNLENIENRQIITLVACMGNSSKRLLLTGIEI